MSDSHSQTARHTGASVLRGASFMEHWHSGIREEARKVDQKATLPMKVGEIQQAVARNGSVSGRAYGRRKQLTQG
jgi:hypothetical protein